MTPDDTLASFSVSEMHFNPSAAAVITVITVILP